MKLIPDLDLILVLWRFLFLHLAGVLYNENHHSPVQSIISISLPKERYILIFDFFFVLVLRVCQYEYNLTPGQSWRRNVWYAELVDEFDDFVKVFATVQMRSKRNASSLLCHFKRCIDRLVSFIALLLYFIAFFLFFFLFFNVFFLQWWNFNAYVVGTRLVKITRI